MDRASAAPNPARASVAPVLLGAVTVVFGLQLMRMLFVDMAVYLAQLQDVDLMLIGAMGVVLFSCAFLEPLVRRAIGPRNALIAVVVSLGAVRLVAQVISPLALDLGGNPVVGTELVLLSLGLSAVGTVLFLWSLPLMFRALLVAEGRGGAAHGVIALLVGLSGDTALKGAFGTIEVSWAAGAAGHLAVTALWVLQALLLVRTLAAQDVEQGEEREVTTPAWPYLAFGPALALEFLLFQNIAHQTVVIGWPQPSVYALIVAANVLGVAAAIELTRWNRSLPWPVSVLLGGLLVAIVAVDQSGAWAALGLVAGQTVMGISLASIVKATSGSASDSSNGSASTWIGAGMLLILALLFLYYAGYDTDVLVPREAVRPAAAIVVGLVAVGALLSPRAGGVPVTRAAGLPALLLLVLPLLYIASWKSVEPAQGAGFPIRVMSYNLHQGFDVHGRSAMERLAKVIETEEADIVALQEVSRGWVANGSVDMLSWLSQRLDMDYAWGPASDPVWGNAVLSRFPIIESTNHEMPNNDVILLDRSYLTLKVALGNGETLEVVATHFHSGDGDSVVRVPQAQAVLDAIDVDRTTVLLGDLNAHPGHPEVLLLAAAGLVDAFGSSGAPGSGFTYPSDDPYERIDYVWSSPDLKARDLLQPGQRGVGPFGRGGHALPVAFLKRSSYLLAFASAVECALCAAAGAADRVVCPMSGSDAPLPCRTLLAGLSSLELYPLLGLDAPLPGRDA